MDDGNHELWSRSRQLTTTAQHMPRVLAAVLIVCGCGLPRPAAGFTPAVRPRLPCRRPVSVGCRAADDDERPHTLADSGVRE
jgi:hypothetical protein